MMGPGGSIQRQTSKIIYNQIIVTLNAKNLDKLHQLHGLGRCQLPLHHQQDDCWSSGHFSHLTIHFIANLFYAEVYFGVGVAVTTLLFKTRSLHCIRITIHTHMFVSIALNNLAWLFW